MKSLLRKEEGSFTVEASLLLPAVFVTVLLLMFFCLYLYQYALSAQAAAVAAERISYSWNNSSKDSKTGSYKEGEYDPLYWRLTEDALLQSVFGLNDSSKLVQSELPAGDPSDSKSIAGRKLDQTGIGIPGIYNGRLIYSNGLLKRSVKADLTRKLPVSPLNKALGGEWGVKARSISYIVEPAEWIRTVELARYYTARFRSSGDEGVKQADAGAALQLFAK